MYNRGNSQDNSPRIERMKQVVCEKWNGQSVQITLTYPKNSLVFNMKERQEQVFVKNAEKNRKTVIYWIWVANDAPKSENVRKPYKAPVNKKLQKKRERISELHEKKRKRMARYAQMIAQNREIEFTAQDFLEGTELMSLIGRQKKSMKDVNGFRMTKKQNNKFTVE